MYLAKLLEVTERSSQIPVLAYRHKIREDKVEASAKQMTP